jgi:cellulose synthase/poly-beta-1,6-N-acetylglucosamine synthase-like glycosyltransferase
MKTEGLPVSGSAKSMQHSPIDAVSLLADGPHRVVVHEDDLLDQAKAMLRRKHRSFPVGVLAVLSVAEMPQLRAKLGSHADEVVAETIGRLLSYTGIRGETHAHRSGGGFWLLMPDADAGTACRRLRELSSQVVGSVLDIAGEQVRITPVIGYSASVWAKTVTDFCEQVDLASESAFLHLDLVPVGYSPALAVYSSASPSAGDRLLSIIDYLRLPLQLAFTLALLLSLPFIVYVLVWDAGFDLTTVTYPLMAAALTGTAAAMWIECFMAVGAVEVPAETTNRHPCATAIIAAYLPNEAATIVDTVTNMLGQDYPGEFQVILAYNSPQHLPIEDTLTDLAQADGRLLLLRVEHSTSKAQNVNAALAHVKGEFVGIFDADHHPAPGSFSRAWRWLSHGHDIVQGHCVVRNGEASWVARMVAVEFEAIYAVSHPGRARLHGFGIFGGSNGYWRRDALRRIRMQRAMLTEDIDSSMRSLRNGFSIVSDPGLISSELAPISIHALWHQRLRWAQGWTQTAWRHIGPALTSDRLTRRQKIGAGFLLGWAQLVPWVTIQLLPILAFTIWRDGGLQNLDFLLPLFVLLTVFTFSVGPAQAIFAYLLGDARIRNHRRWFGFYALHSMLWFAEFKNLIARVAQVKEIFGERQWRVTPRTTASVQTEAASLRGPQGQ